MAGALEDVMMEAGIVEGLLASHPAYFKMQHFFIFLGRTNAGNGATGFHLVPLNYRQRRIIPIS